MVIDNDKMSKFNISHIVSVMKSSLSEETALVLYID